MTNQCFYTLRKLAPEHACQVVLATVCSQCVRAIATTAGAMAQCRLYLLMKGLGLSWLNVAGSRNRVNVAALIRLVD